MITRIFLHSSALSVTVTAFLFLIPTNGWAEDTPRVHEKQLLEALNQKKTQALSEAEEAQLLIAGYEEFLEDPELNPEERPKSEKASSRKKPATSSTRRKPEESK